MEKAIHIIGWREWVSLPLLNISKIKAKIDTGARTSALHAFRVDCFMENGQKKVNFSLHPRQSKEHPVVECTADLKEMRVVTDSGGHQEERPVIVTLLRMGDREWPIEITLTSRDDMRFRMLLGRTALQQQLIVNPSLSYQLSQ